MAKQDAMMRAVFNIKETTEAIPSASSIVDETIDLVLQKWRKGAVEGVGGEHAQSSYLEFRAGLKPVNAEIETVLTEMETALVALSDTRLAARAEAGK